MMEILKIQKIVRKAIKEYEITAKYEEEVLVLFLLSDIFREANGMNDVPEKTKRTPIFPKDIEVLS